MFRALAPVPSGLPLAPGGTPLWPPGPAPTRAFALAEIQPVRAIVHAYGSCPATLVVVDGDLLLTHTGDRLGFIDDAGAKWVVYYYLLSRLGDLKRRRQ